MYKTTDKISDLMAHEEDAIQIISRFGLELGVGEQTIEQVCEAHQVHTPTFLAIVNYKLYRQPVTAADIDVPTLQRFLSNAHAYFWRNSHFAGYNLCNYYGYQHVIEFKVLESKNGKRKCSISQNAG